MYTGSNLSSNEALPGVAAGGVSPPYDFYQSIGSTKISADANGLNSTHPRTTLPSGQTTKNADSGSSIGLGSKPTSAECRARHAGMCCSTERASTFNPESATGLEAFTRHLGKESGAGTVFPAHEMQLPPLRSLAGMTLGANSLPSLDNVLEKAEAPCINSSQISSQMDGLPRSAATPIAALSEDTRASVSKAIFISEADSLDPPLIISPVSPRSFTHTEVKNPVAQRPCMDAPPSYFLSQPQNLPQQPALGIIMQHPLGSVGLDPSACRLPSVYPITPNEPDFQFATYPQLPAHLNAPSVYMTSMLGAQSTPQINSGTNQGPFRHRASKPALTSNSKQGSNPANTAGFPTNYPIYECIDKSAIPADAADQIKLLPAASNIEKKRYATSMDERNFLTVYEYIVKDHPVIWDYYTGFVHLTGIWKMLGNTKADIVRLLDNAPDLEPHIRRVRGGFLRIQGTWLPYTIARAVATRISWPIRYALVPVFGPSFPSECLRPEDPGYGQLQAVSVPKRSFGQALANIAYTEASLGDGSSRSIRRRISEPVIKAQRSDKAFKLREPQSRGNSLENSSEELLTMLQASRSLQLLAAGPQSQPDTSGADFEFGGRRYSWDGQTSLCQL